MSEVTKVTVNLPDADVQELREIARLKGTTLTEAIRQSIQINKYLIDQERNNAKFLVETPDGRIRQIIRK